MRELYRVHSLPDATSRSSLTVNLEELASETGMARWLGMPFPNVWGRWSFARLQKR